VRRSGAQPIVTSTAVTGFTSPNASISPLGESSPRPRWSWMGATLAYRPPPEETGGIAVWKDIDVLGIAASLGVIAFAWLIAGLLVWLWNQTLRRRELAASPKWGRRIAVVATVALMLVLAWVTMSRTDTPRVVSGGALPKALATRVKGLNAPVATSLNSAALEAISRAPDCDRQLAQVIIGAVDVAGSDTEALLAVVLQPEAIMKPMSSTSTSYNWSFQLLSTSSRYFTRRPASDAPRDPLTGASPVGEPMTFPAGWEWEFGPSSASIRRSTGNPTDPVHYISISLEWLGCLFLALWILWLVARIPTHVFVVRQRLRRRRNQCTACGHALGPAHVA